MKTGYRGTFVITWAQTELEGLRSAPLSTLQVGASWGWSGEALRVDGPTGILPLGEAEGMVEMRRRAALSLRRLLAANGIVPAPVEDADSALPLFDKHFVVTDGRDAWTIALVEQPNGGRPLLMFDGEIPPRMEDLWVVRLSGKLAEPTPDHQAMGGVICFTPGTMILTDKGAQPVETIQVGDRIQTKDNGFDHVHWTGERRLTGARLVAMPHLAPVLLRPGALNDGVPDAGLLVSPDHRLLLKGDRAQVLFNTDEVLVTARDLVNDHSVLIDRSRREVTYIHLLLSRHQIVFANGVETESFHPASAAFATMGDADKARLFETMPDLAADPLAYGDPARRVLRQSEALILRGPEGGYFRA